MTKVTAQHYDHNIVAQFRQIVKERLELATNIQLKSKKQSQSYNNEREKYGELINSSKERIGTR